MVYYGFPRKPIQILYIPYYVLQVSAVLKKVLSQLEDIASKKTLPR